jgi:uncharacterized membrane protein YkvA (DUF1232 family)
MNRLREKASALKRETMALYFAMRDPRTPWIARIMGGMVVAYVLSPIDLIPDFIPILGLLDDLILVPVGIALCLRLIPYAVLVEARERALLAETRPTSYVAAAVFVLLWLAAILAFSTWLYRTLFSA